MSGSPRTAVPRCASTRRCPAHPRKNRMSDTDVLPSSGRAVTTGARDGRSTLHLIYINLANGRVQRVGSRDAFRRICHMTRVSAVARRADLRPRRSDNIYNNVTTRICARLAAADPTSRLLDGYRRAWERGRNARLYNVCEETEEIVEHEWDESIGSASRRRSLDFSPYDRRNSTSPRDSADAASFPPFPSRGAETRGYNAARA